MSKTLKIMKLIVNSMRGKSFTIDFNDNYTAILGTNGAGKGTVLEALSWVLTGTSVYGDKVSLISKGDSFTSVTAQLLKDGRNIEVTRELKRTSSGTSAQIRVDHIQATQAEIDDMIGVSSKILKSIIFPKTFLAAEKAEKMKILLGLSDKTLKTPTDDVPFDEYASVIKEYKDMSTSAQSLYNQLVAEIDEKKALKSRFETYDVLVSKKFFGSISDFVSDGIQKIFDTYRTIGVLDMDELSALKKYLEIGSSEALSVEIEELEKHQDEAYDIIDAASKEIGKTNTAVADELQRISNIFGLHGLIVETSKDKDKVSLASLSYNGIQLAALSGKEQVETSAAVHDAMCSLIDAEFPIFIENGESVVGEDKLEAILSGVNQAIVCYVSDTPLAIDNGDGKTCTAICTNQTVNRSKLWQVRIVNFV